MYQNSLFYLQQGTAYVVEQEENSIFLLSNNLAFTLRPQDLGSKAPSISIKPQLTSSLMAVNSLTDTMAIAKGNSNINIQSKSNLNSNTSLKDTQTKSKSSVLSDKKAKTQNLNPSYQEDSNLNFQTFNIELVQFKNSHYSYPLVRQIANFSGKEFYNSHLLLQLNRANTSARIVRATKGGYLCLICGVLGFLPKTHAPRFLYVGSSGKSHGGSRHHENKFLKSLSKKKFKGLGFGLQTFKTLYSFSDLCERHFFLSIPCRFLSRIVYPPKTQRGKFQFSFVFTSFPLDLILRERSKYITNKTVSSSSTLQLSDNTFINNFNSSSNSSVKNVKTSNSIKNKSEVKQYKKFGSDSKRIIKS